MKMRENVKSKLDKYLEVLLDVPSAYKYHWWFALIFNPLYIKQLKYVRKMYEIETFDTRIIINEMMPKFYDYIATAELAENPYTEPTAVTTYNLSLCLNK